MDRVVESTEQEAYEPEEGRAGKPEPETEATEGGILGLEGKGYGRARGLGCGWARCIRGIVRGRGIRAAKGA